MRNTKTRILVCPLGWGLGHASRLIPIIQFLKDEGYEIIVAGDKPQLLLISYRFPDIQTINFPSFNVSLSKGKSQLLPLIGVAIRLPYHTIREHFALKRIIRENKIDLIISDNRYGLWCKGVKSIFITHQLKVIFPKPFRFLEPIGLNAVRFFSSKFKYCLVPDFSDERNLAGELSNPGKKPKNIKYIETLSRFSDIKIDENSEEWDLVGISSGPSPHREIFIQEISRLSKLYNLKTLIIKGSPKEGMQTYIENGISYCGHLSDKDFANAVLSSKYLITRSGYCTIMDLYALGVGGLIVPTPGQTEQEYLAEFLSNKGLFKTCKQDEILKTDIELALLIKRPTVRVSNLFKEPILELLNPS